MASVQPIVVKASVELEGGLVIGPHDFLAVRVSPGISDYEYDEMITRLNARLPREMHGRIVILACEEFAKVEAG
jgi:hypothetical protein